VPGETQRETGKASHLDTATVLEARRYLGFTPEPNATALATAIKADPTWTEALQATERSDLGTLGNTVTAVNTLKLQMNPENLGSMVASLRLKGEELTVELRVDSAEAYQQLSADHDDIVKALQDQGFSIDKVTVQLNATDRTDTGADRDMARQGQAQRDGQAEQRDRQDSRSGRNDGQSGEPRWASSGALADGGAGDSRSDTGRTGNIYL
jgi:chemotaxis protein MotD